MENTRVLWLYIILLCHYHWFFEEIDGLVNLALKKPAIQSSTFLNLTASLATDGLIGTRSTKNECSHTGVYHRNPNPWWEVDLGGVHTINRVSVLNRAYFAERLRDINITVISQDKTVTTECAFYQGSVAAAAWATVTCHPGTSGRFVRIQIYNEAYRDVLTLCEVVVEGLSPCDGNIRVKG
ncbi:fucolectin-1-like isoform X2 [Gigantopelta aegis]|uniref:fucolectin-1-like isoform X2 n=1 Tax=Gigantopelta aegis TaxID=1735272 RepID=UPI001B8880C9|nr:fucolectin-1-like isoform X2 [Gigantopelta aegis]